MFLPDWLKNLYLRLITPVIDFFIKRRLNPNHFTTLGFLLSVLTAYLFGSGFLRTAGIIMLISGTFDIIDGKVARATNRVTKFGALYDSTLDRYSEVFIFFGLAYYFVNDKWATAPMPLSLWNLTFESFNLSLVSIIAVCMALGGSVMTSYVRARAEGLGLECKVGWMQRPERVVFIAFGAIFHKLLLIAALILVAIFANLTAVQRLYHIWVTDKEARKKLISE
ncbi:MAG: CDP-alcohol phosphatidyltransferase family protein [candidate division KSB1 bacterium]|nr:CDP-alcohol phosphatidyltransferase family protein [candidate division KSB1 bacterium]MDZ7334801.1 CDP-alcohol phosphatidyltransferase family protein [candidate division KSB1 bacterium]MDZ7357602.1 CDP-alcohol phosphatidyltransferase family protein [candidate division KSB1 bacterium]MDZ7377262.1 CDP-alcohol phosphatidyltransferase family protein [candidate division KSB1 bacterium]MDZ7400798.1 CDP-alcohol phosphatidyltransferase family protein [candidate division KSB1 bacterium]